MLPKPISRQRKWQLKQIALGNCMICGKKRDTPKNVMYCDEHRGKVNLRRRSRVGT